MMSSYVPSSVVADDDGLQHAELADAVDELGQIVRVEVRARLAWVRDDRVRVDVREPRTGDLDELLVARSSLRSRRAAGEEDVDRARLRRSRSSG